MVSNAQFLHLLDVVNFEVQHTLALPLRHFKETCLAVASRYIHTEAVLNGCCLAGGTYLAFTLL